ncbi:MAG: periplasmic heavy metal sensor [Burkholderiales bacterium]
MKTRNARWTGAVAAALFAMGSYAALAQPGGGMRGYGPGPGAGPGGGFAIEQVMASLKSQLELNTSQQMMWDNAVAQSRAARESGRAVMEQAHAALTAELAKNEPDFAAVANAADAAHANAQALRKQVRDEWLKLYATFSPAQKAVVRDAVKARVARMDEFRNGMRERMKARTPG